MSQETSGNASLTDAMESWFDRFYASGICFVMVIAASFIMISGVAVERGWHEAFTLWAGLNTLYRVGHARGQRKARKSA